MKLLVFLFLTLGLPIAAQDQAARPICITIDDLPVIAPGRHPEFSQRKAITDQILAQLARHKIKAVGLVTWSNLVSPQDVSLLNAWLDAGHELGNHSYSHQSYTHTDTTSYIADIERARVKLTELLEPRDQELRWFRFPMLREGETESKLRAMRSYLNDHGMRNLPVSIDNQDWSFERPYVDAMRAHDQAAMNRIGVDYLAALRIMVRHHERSGDQLFDRTLPQIMLLHASSVTAAHLGAFLDWLEESGHVFATAESVMADPAFATPPDYVGRYGPGLWDRIASQRRIDQARADIETLLQAQAAAWSRGDIDAFCGVYAEDAAFLSSSGITRGRGTIKDRYRKRYPDAQAMGRLTLDILDFNPAQGTEVSILGDARPSKVHGATVVAKWTLHYEARDDFSGHTLIVFRKSPSNDWQIVQDASM